jgi:hypothetical protein
MLGKFAKKVLLLKYYEWPGGGHFGGKEGQPTLL